MLQLDHEKRCDYLTCFQLEMFKVILKSKPQLYQNTHQKLANLIANIINKKTSKA